MWDIFVNYRREDGHAAGRLVDFLETEFATFIDRKMRSGAEFDKEIEEALDHARIVIAVIGKGWISPENMRRLQDPEDWVHRELDQALNRTGAEVIPAIVDDGIRLPDTGELPEPLRRFNVRNAAFLRQASWEQDVKRLTDSFQPFLRTRGIARPRVRARTMPGDLPFLCNRLQQEQEFEELAASARESRSLVCVLHGHKYEAHANFVTRLRHRRTLENAFRASTVGIDLFPLEWNRAHARNRNYQELLRSAIKRSAMRANYDATDANLFAFLKDTGRPAVMMMQLAWSDIELYGRSMLDDLAVAWHELIGQLGAPPNQALLLWINLSYENAAQELEAGNLPRLERLGPVLESDIQTWLLLEEVRDAVEGRESALLNIASDPQYYIQPGQVHMLRFAEAARALMTKK